MLPRADPEGLPLPVTAASANPVSGCRVRSHPAKSASGHACDPGPRGPTPSSPLGRRLAETTGASHWGPLGRGRCGGCFRSLAPLPVAPAAHPAAVSALPEVNLRQYENLASVGKNLTKKKKKKSCGWGREVEKRQLSEGRGRARERARKAFLRPPREGGHTRPARRLHFQWFRGNETSAEQRRVASGRRTAGNHGRGNGVYAVQNGLTQTCWKCRPRRVHSDHLKICVAFDIT